MYFDVESVRTKDNALISVKLMLFYHLQNVEQMLDATNDPIADFVNAVSADVIEWCSSRKFDEFLANTDALNTLIPYAQLTAQATKIGFELTRLYSVATVRRTACRKCTTRPLRRGRLWRWLQRQRRRSRSLPTSSSPKSPNVPSARRSLTWSA